MYKKKPTRPPAGWLPVQRGVAEAVDEAVQCIAPGLTFTDQDAWGAGMSPRVGPNGTDPNTPDARIGPTAAGDLLER